MDIIQVPTLWPVSWPTYAASGSHRLLDRLFSDFL